MICPYCSRDIHLTTVGNDWAIMHASSPGATHTFQGGFCPACRSVIVLYKNTLGTITNGLATEEGYQRSIIFPKNRLVKRRPPEIPSDYVKEFDEARLVLDISSKSSTHSPPTTSKGVA